MEFTEFGLHEDLLKGINEAGYVTCTPVQEQVLKASQEGVDLYVQSQTGTGKTAAYLISILQSLLAGLEMSGKKALIMVPTRELAVQVEEEAKKLSRNTKLVCASFYGGVGYDKQVATLKKGVDIMVGTPGRVIDLQEGGQMDLTQVAYLVVDEADRMFDMGFYPDLRTLIKVLPAAEKRQTMLFSATLNSYVKNLAWEYTRDAREITIAADNITVDDIDQELIHVSSDEKNRLLVGILNAEKPSSVMIFCNTKRMCEVLSKRLDINGVKSGFIIGDLPQRKRLDVLNAFKEGKISCLVATDVAARGIDVNDLAMVINYDLPNEAENYVHRIGRTARAGKTGKAYTLCSEQDVYNLPAIERYIDKQIPSRVADESMLGEDKSKDIYIKIQEWHEDYDDKSSFGRKRASERGYSKGRRGNGRRNRDLDLNKARSTAASVADAAGAFATSDENSFKTDKKERRGKGRYSSRNRARANEYRRDRRGGQIEFVNRSPEDEEKMANMSFEERMKLYKEMYAGNLTEPTAQPLTQDKQAGKKSDKKRSSKRSDDRKSYKKADRRSDKKNNSGKTLTPSSTSSVKQEKNAQTVAPSKKGLKSRSLISRIKAFFGRK
ncbi:MAG: DEAD/DEAH box helicase [Treponema sp.]|nr:DEAD/DEAH box helicase [Treponema sp.]